MKVSMEKQASLVSVFPNPVGEDGMLHVSLSNKAAGIYQVSIVNNEGKQVLNRLVNHGGGSSVYSILMKGFIAHGNYLVKITGDDNVKSVFKIVY